MAEESEKRSNLEETLEPFHQRASEAEVRLSRLETALASKKDAGKEGLLETISDLQSKLEDANAHLVSEREKGEKLAGENAKLQYRIIHLVQALRKSDLSLEIMKEAAAETISTIQKFEDLRRFENLRV